jgi:nucleoside diphosphate kinase
MASALSTINTERTEKAGMEIACVILKPDTIADGRKDAIVAYLKDFCKNNSLTIVEERQIPPEIADRMRKMHFDGDAKLEETGEKVLKAFIRRGIDEVQYSDLLRKHGLDLQDKKSIGRWIMDVETRSYEGKGSHLVVVAGEGAISKLFSIRGGSDPMFAEDGTLRHMFSKKMSITEMFDGAGGKPLDNVLHIPDTIEETNRHLRAYTGKGYGELLAEINSKQPDFGCNKLRR